VKILRFFNDFLFPYIVSANILFLHPAKNLTEHYRAFL